MIITRTPFRISFFGGGTDIEEYFNKYRGAVISTTFDKYCYVNVRHLPRFFSYNNQITYSKIERVKRVNEIEHTAVREAMKMLDMHELIINYDADLPARTGLGTSSSFAVGMLNAFYALKGKYMNKKTLADKAIYLERFLCKEAGGWQDQIAVSFGGFNRIDFNASGYHVKPLIINPERKQKLNDNLMLFFTGFTHISSIIHEKSSIKGDRNKYLNQMYNLVDRAESILLDKKTNLNEFGKLLDESWQLKKLIGKDISTKEIDRIYKKAIKNGALGGKLLGAGGGGFMLFYVPKRNQTKVKKALSNLLYVPFKFEETGTQVIYYHPEEYSINNQ